MTNLITLKNSSNWNLKSVWGKWASLIKIKKTWIPVPDFFIISTDIFEKFIREILISWDFEKVYNNSSMDYQELNSIYNKIKEKIMETTIDKKIEENILNAIDDLNSDFVAIRSSWILEDGVKNSWAWQLDSHLNISKKETIRYIKECWASLFSARSLYYWKKHNINFDKFKVAVIVQKIVESQISGVIFTVNPISKDTNELIIEAWNGLWESVVSGKVIPDNITVDKRNMKILNYIRSTQEKWLFVNKSWWTEWKNIINNNLNKVSQKQVEQLCSIAIKIEKIYKMPCDIEWAIEKEVLYILQSRAITTL